MTSRLTDAAVNAVILMIVGLGKFLAWFLNFKAVYYPLTAIAIVGAGFYFWQAEPFKPAPPTRFEIVQRAQVTIDTVLAEHLATLAADDGQTDQQHKFMAHAALNYSEKHGGLSIKHIYEGKLTLAAPSQEGSMMPRYIRVADVGSADNAAKAVKEAIRILTGDNRKQDWKAFPCLQEIQRYIRPEKWGTWQLFYGNEKKMRDEGWVLLYENTLEKAKYFGPPGSTAKCQ
ncbi:hypothetical protein A3A40_00185 [Candidatus Kaiserbacteria bacterium RIFCSPLOWO2_01_FULL_54_20]|uniref:Uncharacterized protein n=1 Tax=Candidatus Kaiserbacteria bacterium RIFCSPLOWO2_01_FULL_54_20 TaxID=1798513 RepID=A0A1F6EKM6_9BACT|nr:MAG: hypothetical protein A3A40_00185 [Candidatus Kaiserbacteria bacterium RIFCSPLOWO2_01_FULL_54_20]